MDSYLKKINNLRASDRSQSASRSRGPSAEPGPRVPVPVPVPVPPEKKTTEEPKVSKISKKVAYKSDIEEVKKMVEESKIISMAVRSQVEEVKKSVMSKMDEHQASLERDCKKKQEEVNNCEKLKDKLDNFISSYNENEVAHSTLMKKVEDRLKNIEEAF